MPATMRRLLLPASRISGIQRVFRLRSKGPTVLFYHGVEENFVDPVIQRMHTPLRIFEKQIAFLRRNREVISIDDLYESIVGRKSLDSRQVVLTFDDGYKNNLRIVAPLLQGWNLPFTLFVSTRHISERRRFPLYYIRVAALYAEKRHMRLRSIPKSFDLTSREMRLAAAETIVEVAKSAPLDRVEDIVAECIEQLPSERWAELNAQFKSDEPMDWDDLRCTASLGATIGSHCHDHCILHANQSTEEVHRQLNESKSAIERNVGECKYLAYPNGTAADISSVAYSAAKSTQFRMAFSTIRGEVTSDADCFLIPRLFALREYEEFCYLLNRSSKQNEFYRTASLQCNPSSQQPGTGWNHESERS